MSVPSLSDKTEKALREIGLTEYETLAYISLLEYDEMTAEDISKTSSIPYTKVYSVLDSLEERGWLEHTNGRPRIYYPRPPVDALKAEELRLETEFDINSKTVVDELQPIFEKKDIRELPEIWIIRGEDNSFNKIIELMDKAKKEIMLAIPWIPEELLKISPSFQDILKQNIRKFMDTDVQIKLLTTKEILSSISGPELGVIEIRLCDSMFGGGLIIDDRECIVFLDLSMPYGPDTSIWSEHETLTTVAGIYYQYMWDNSEPFTP
ncbi:MAG: hypothetical protein NWE89_05790 [Candidatus Bathyarchaeota archaeon]|nr:hypothetical protein [Candidatus Bathyarchaeota archaeon]